MNIQPKYLSTFNQFLGSSIASSWKKTHLEEEKLPMFVDLRRNNTREQNVSV